MSAGLPVIESGAAAAQALANEPVQPAPAWLGAIYATLLGLWVGAQAAVGFLVAPLLFAVLPDRSQAGTVAGVLFAWLGWIALGVIAVLLAVRWRLDRGASRPDSVLLRRLLVLAWSLTALGHFVLRPWIAALRRQIEASGGFELGDPALRARFGMLHGASSLLFLLATLCGLALLWRLRDRRST